MVRHRQLILKEVVLLIGYSIEEEIVFEDKIGLHKYYDDLHPVIDESEFRKRRKIRRLIGKLYGSKGELIQEFENTYKEDGTYEKGITKHSDGTVTKNY